MPNTVGGIRTLTAQALDLRPLPAGLLRQDCKPAGGERTAREACVQMAPNHLHAPSFPPSRDAPSAPAHPGDTRTRSSKPLLSIRCAPVGFLTDSLRCPRA